MDQQQRTWEELKALYGWCIDDLREFKGREWKTSYYILTVYAALGLVAQQIAKGTTSHAFWSGVLLALTGAAVMIFGLITIQRLEAAMNLRRDRMAEVMKSFSREFNEARLPKDRRGKDETESMFKAVIFIGWAVLTFYIYRL